MYVITGPSSGLGLEVARQLLTSPNSPLEAGETLFGLSRREPDIDNPNFRWLEYDQADPDSIEATAAEIMASEEKLRSVAHIAGVLSLQTFENIDPEEARRVMSVNVEGLSILHGKLLPRIREDQSTTVVVGSTVGYESKARQPIYAASHAARISLVGAMRDGLQHVEGAAVHLIAPGAFQPSGMAKNKPGKLYIPTPHIAARIVELLGADTIVDETVIMHRRKAGSTE